MGKALVRCFAECCIPPHIVNHPAFRDLIGTAQANPRAKLPDRHSLMRDHGRSGTYLTAVLADAIAERKRVIVDANIQGVAGNLLADGAKSIKRSTNVTFFKSSCSGKISTALVQHTTASSISKTGEWLLEDICKALDICEGLIFLVCLDGAAACQKALRLLHVKYSHVFGQRCCLHAWSLVLGDFAQLPLFRATVKIFLKLIVFINSHERAYTLLESLGGAALLQAAPTRMGKEVLALQGLFKDKNRIEQLFVHNEIFVLGGVGSRQT